MTGSAEVYEIPVIRKFWPQGGPDKLRAAAGVWRRAAELIDEAERRAALIDVYCSGDTITAFAAYVRRLYAAAPSGNTVVDPGQPLTENLSRAAGR